MYKTCCFKAVVTMIIGIVCSCNTIAASPTDKHNAVGFTYLNYPVLFEDENLIEQDKRIILADYISVLQKLVPGEQQPAHHRILTLNDGQSVVITNALRFSAKYAKRPSGYEHQFGLIGRLADQSEALIIPKILSDGYKQSIALVHKHAQATAELSQYIDMLNDLRVETLPPVRNLLDLLYLHGQADKYKNDILEKDVLRFVNDFSVYRYAEGSILEYCQIDGKLLATICVFDKATNDRTGELHIIYDDNRWKVFISLQ